MLARTDVGHPAVVRGGEGTSHDLTHFTRHGSTLSLTTLSQGPHSRKDHILARQLPCHGIAAAQVLPGHKAGMDAAESLCIGRRIQLCEAPRLSLGPAVIRQDFDAARQ